MSSSLTPPSYRLPTWAKPMFNPALRRMYLVGGRASGKTKAVAAYVILRIIDDHMPGNYDEHNRRLPCNVLCTRETQTSIADSVKEELEDVIFQMNLDKEFKILKDRIEHPRTRSSITFMGLFQSVQRASTKGMHNIRLTWAEESNVITRESIRQLEPTVMREEGSQIIYTSNVAWESDPTYEDLIYHEKKQSDDVFIKKDLSIFDNPFCTRELLEFAADEKRRDPEMFEHIWLGKPYSSSIFTIFKKGKHWDFGDMDKFVNDNELTPVFGMDGGNTENSPAAIVKAYRIDKDTIYVSDSRHQHNMADRHLPSLICGNARPFFDEWDNPYGHDALIRPSQREGYHIFFDSANVNAIKELRRHKFNVTEATEAKKSVIKRIQWLHGHKIIVNDKRIKPNDVNSPKRTELLQTEFMKYEYEKLTGTDDTPDFTKPKKNGFDHAIDALGYAMTPYLKLKGDKPKRWAVGLQRFGIGQGVK